MMLRRLLQISPSSARYSSSAFVGSAFSSRGHRMNGWQINRLSCVSKHASQKLSLHGTREDEGDDTTTPRSDTANKNDDSSILSNNNQNTTSCYSVSVCAKEGRRYHMEDEYFCSHHGDFCAVFDGHGGSGVSRYLRDNLYANVIAALSAAGGVKPQTETPTVLDYSNALTQGIEEVDQEVLRNSDWNEQGSTAVAVWIHEDKSISSAKAQEAAAQTIIAANVGDSRAILSREGVAIDLTRDHKPNDPIERARIEAAGGKVTKGKYVDYYRVNGILAMSRAIGDQTERPIVSGEPEIFTELLDETGDEFIVLASDGLWDVMSSQDCASFVHAELNKAKNRSFGSFAENKEEIAKWVVEEALRRDSNDNISVVIMWLNVAET